MGFTYDKLECFCTLFYSSTKVTHVIVAVLIIIAIKRFVVTTIIFIIEYDMISVYIIKSKAKPANGISDIGFLEEQAGRVGYVRGP
jgi:hypothetical protein